MGFFVLLAFVGGGLFLLYWRSHRLQVKGTIDYLSTMITDEDLVKAKEVMDSYKEAADVVDDEDEKEEYLETYEKLKIEFAIKEKLAALRKDHMIPVQYTYVKQQFESMSVVKVRYQNISNERKFVDVIFYMNFIVGKGFFSSDCWIVKEVKILDADRPS